VKSLLPFYERELGFVRSKSLEFARQYPKIATGLGLSTEAAQDPHVERMIESFALLSARIHKRLDDDFPLLTESLLEVLYPHYLRPFPSCSIACFDAGGAASQLNKAVVLTRGTVLSSRPVKGVVCKFRTTQEVTLLPVSVVAAEFRNAISAPDGTPLPLGVTSVLSLTLDLNSPQASWAELAEHGLRLYLDGEPSVVSVLREVLCRKVRGVLTQPEPHQPWVPHWAVGLDGALPLPRLVGFHDQEALIDFDVRSHTAYRLLTEYFAFPEKFNFVDIPVPVPQAMRGDVMPTSDDSHAQQARCRITVHLPISGVRTDSDEARLLETIDHRNLVLGCTPVVNLISQSADPIRVTHTAVSYPVVVDARRAYGYEVYSVDKVFRVKQTPQGEAVDAFRPFFSLQHEDLVVDDEPPGKMGLDGMEFEGDARGSPKSGGRYWSLHREEDVAEHSPGYECSLSIVDLDFLPAQAQTDTLSLTVTATNRDLPSQMSVGLEGGDLFMEGGGVARQIRLLRKPTPSLRFDRKRGALWRLVSHLSLNHLSLSGGGIDALKEMLRLYDLPRSASNRRQIDGLLSVEFKPATAWLPGEPFATFVRGTEVRITIDEESFVGTGLALPAAVLDQFFSLYAHANSFTRLTLVSARTQEEVLACSPRNGDISLV
jgi:type VI secretion system protein ImpG